MTVHGTDCASACPLAIAADGKVRVNRAGDGVGGIGRRAFLGRGMLAAAAVALAACSPIDSISGPANISGLTIKVSDYSALATTGGIAMVNASGTSIAVVRTGAASFVALSRVCPHQGGTVSADGTGGFTCPQHGARFSANGTWIGGQRTTNLHAYATSYDAAAGTLTIG